jgi:predicted metal-dependent hydrolase
VVEAPLFPSPDLSPEEQASFEKGVDQFNEGHFFECHDTLEELWSGVRGPSRDFFQGLIQVAVGFYHLGKDNRVGAVRLLGRALERLEAYPDHYGGIDLGELREAVTAWRRRLDSAPVDISSRPVPRLRRVSAASARTAPRRPRR